MDVAVTLVFAVLAGAGTALSPCVLPVLPVALAAGATGGRRRPLGVAVGLAASFAVAAVLLTRALDALGLPGDLARALAIAVLAAFGLALLVPPLGAAVEARLSRLVRARPAAARGDGFRSGLVLGVSLGLVYAPCAGPILAAVVALGGAVSAERWLIGFAYGAGAAAALFAVMVGGRRVVRALAPRAGRLQQGLGALMVARRAAARRGRGPRLPGRDRRRPARGAGQPHRRARARGGGRPRAGRRARRRARRPARRAPAGRGPGARVHRHRALVEHAGRGRSRCARCAAASC